MATTLLLARHAETGWNYAERFTGISDVPLNDTGLFQAQALARQIIAFNAPVASVYSSALQRSRSTVQPLAERLGIEVQVIPELRELDYGEWEGLTLLQIQAHSLELFPQWLKDPAALAPPGGETGIALVERVLPVIKALVVRHEGQVFFIAGHKSVNRLLICALFGIPLASYRQAIRQDPACLNELCFDDSQPSLVHLNDTCHLKNK